MVPRMPGPARLESFLIDQLQCLAQRIDHRNGRGVMIKAFFVPVTLHHRHVEIPTLYLRFAAVDRLYRPRAERDRGQAGRTAQALLRAAVDGVDAPAVDLDRHAA